MAGLLIWLLIFCLVVFGVYYIINNVLPEPFRRIATVVAVIVLLIVLIYWLSGMAGGAPVIRLHG